tara:strand:+ start:1278 stop:1916 length:639 start_codon:yes stop_codon:yes gene_type:complete
MTFDVESYLAQERRWPQAGRVILAQFDSETVQVYQAYRPGIARFAVEHGYFGGDFKLGRMTWIKPNFLWMMYRSSWGQSSDQEVVLAVRIKRSAFDEILRASVHSTFRAQVYDSEQSWRERLAHSDVRLQWDPDHAPGGEPVARRAIQLGLRGAAAAAYAREWVVSIDDVSEFVAEQRAALRGADYSELSTPREEPYPVAGDIAEHLELESD